MKPRIPFADPSTAVPVDKLAASLVPESLCRKYTVVPLRLEDDGIEEMITAIYGSEAAIFDLLEKFPETSAVECLDSEEDGDRPEGQNHAAAPVIRRRGPLLRRHSIGPTRDAEAFSGAWR